METKAIKIFDYIIDKKQINLRSINDQTNEMNYFSSAFNTSLGLLFRGCYNTASYRLNYKKIQIINIKSGDLLGNILQAAIMYRNFRF